MKYKTGHYRINWRDIPLRRKSQKKYKTLKLFELKEKFMSDTFLDRITQFEKTESIGTFYFLLRFLKCKIHFRN